MKTFIKPDNSLWAFEEDGSQDDFITPDMLPISEEEADKIRYPVLPAIIPQSVTRFQARAALLLTESVHEGFNNMLEEVNAFMETDYADPLAKLAWADAQEFKRESPTILFLASLLGIDEKSLDNLFILANTIDA